MSRNVELKLPITMRPLASLGLCACVHHTGSQALLLGPDIGRGMLAQYVSHRNYAVLIGPDVELHPWATRQPGMTGSYAQALRCAVSTAGAHSLLTKYHRPFRLSALQMPSKNPSLILSTLLAFAHSVCHAYTLCMMPERSLCLSRALLGQHRLMTAHDTNHCLWRGHPMTMMLSFLSTRTQGM